MTTTKTDLLRYDDGSESYTEVRDEDTPVGRTITRTHVTRAIPEVEFKDCYCCSCDDSGDGFIQPDAYCRNHNYGFGKRPCEEHNMAGTPKVDPDTYADLGILDSVQVENRRHR